MTPLNHTVCRGGPDCQQSVISHTLAMCWKVVLPLCLVTAGLCCYVLKLKFGVDVIKMTLHLCERRTLSPDTPTSAEVKTISDVEPGDKIAK